MAEASHYIEEIEYIRSDEIGSGAFGKVYKAYGVKSYKLYAVKDIECTKNDDLDSGIDEIRALGGLKHGNIVALYNVKASQAGPFKATLSLLLEYCDGGNLNKRLCRPSSDALNLRWMRQLADAVSYLHSKNVTHRDLKPENILLTADEDTKIADFGLATRFAQRREDQTWLTYYIGRGVGASCYVAPEVLLGRYTYKADVFSLGVTFYAIIERTYEVVKGEKLYGAFVDDGSGKKQPLGIHMFNIKRNVELGFDRQTAINRLVLRALNYDPKMRPKVAHIKRELEQFSKPSCRLF